MICSADLRRLEIFNLPCLVLVLYGVHLFCMVSMWVFLQELHEENNGELPAVLTESINVLRRRGLEAKGLFTGCTEGRKVHLLERAWDQGHNPLKVAKIQDCYAVSLLYSTFRDRGYWSIFCLRHLPCWYYHLICMSIILCPSENVWWDYIKLQCNTSYCVAVNG